MFQPPFSGSRFVSAIMVGYLWGQLVMFAIPEDNFGDIDWRFLNWLIPAAIGLGKYHIPKMLGRCSVFCCSIETLFSGVA